MSLVDHDTGDELVFVVVFVFVFVFVFVCMKTNLKTAAAPMSVGLSMTQAVRS